MYCTKTTKINSTKGWLIYFKIPSRIFEKVKDNVQLILKGKSVGKKIKNKYIYI